MSQIALLSAQHPEAALLIGINSRIAVAETTTRYGLDNTNNVADAFRHAYWNALNASMPILIGLELAKEFADAHESGINVNDPAQLLGRTMDFWNNEQGRIIGNAMINRGNQDIINSVLGAISNGLMRHICHGISIPTNQTC